MRKLKAGTEMNSLSESKSKLGYSDKEINQICRKRAITRKDFDIAFGNGNTMALENGEPRYYKCDVEKALYVLKAKGGKFHYWD